RQQTLRAVVDWSWDLLDDAERAVLRRLSVFAGGCDLPAAEAVCADAPRAGRPPRTSVPRHDRGSPRPLRGPDGSAGVADALGSLIDKSLVVATPTALGEMRYHLLETVAEYAAGRLDEAGERPAVERRHLVHYRELARTTDPLLRGPEQLVAGTVFRTEYENLRTALRRAVAARDEQEALHLVLSLSWYWQMRDLRTEARHWTGAVGALGPDPFAAPVTPAPPVFERFTDAPPPMSPELLAEARRGNALIFMIFMNMSEQGWGTPESLARLRRVTATYRPGLPQTCRNPGTLWFFAVLMTGELDLLKDMLDETVRACRAYGYEWELAAALQARANVLANRGEWAGDATRDADEALEMFTRLGDAWGTAEALSARGEAREQRGDYELAAQDFTTAVTYAERIGARIQAAVLRARLGGVLLEAGQEERGEALLREVLAEHEDTDNECTAVARIYLAQWIGRTGRRDEARSELLRLLDQFRLSPVAVFEGIVLGCLAWLDLVDRRYRQALDRAREALGRARDPLSTMLAPQMAALQLVTAAG
ncbi:ATP-binding protein, partial [Streptomyces sp. NPDC055078]